MKDISFGRKLSLNIPFLRRLLCRATFKGADYQHINLTLCRWSCPHMCKAYNARTIDDADIFISRKYFAYVLKQMFGKNGKRFSEDMLFEIAHIASDSNLKVVVISVPHTDKIGQTSIIGFVVDEMKHISDSFSMEISHNHKFTICQWHDDAHFNYDTVATKSDFAKRIVSLFKEINHTK